MSRDKELIDARLKFRSISMSAAVALICGHKLSMFRSWTWAFNPFPATTFQIFLRLRLIADFFRLNSRFTRRNDQGLVESIPKQVRTEKPRAACNRPSRTRNSGASRILEIPHAETGTCDGQGFYRSQNGALGKGGLDADS